MTNVEYWALKIEEAQKISRFHFLDVVEEMMSLIEEEREYGCEEYDIEG